MKITNIEIENFRSIKNISLPIEKISDKKALILLGINEAGKSNILKAISLLDKGRLDNVEYLKDCNKGAENKGEDIKIIYDIYDYNLAYFKKRYLEKELYPKELIDSIEFESMHRIISIDKDNKKSSEYHIYLKEGLPISDYIIKDNKITLLKDSYSGEDIVTNENITSLLGEGYSILTNRLLESELEDNFIQLYNIFMPKLIFWEYSDKYLINNDIDLNSFKDDNSISIPLKNIFDIAGIDNISETIEQVSSSKEKKKQLEEKLSENITNHINKLWKEHHINIIIDIDNMICTIMIEDKDNSIPKYNMEQRSDGFKQFISILLNLSAEYKSNILKNKIILLDEPEVHLHPSGVRYLRDELLKISKDNIVIISTHSIYMIDKESLGRHYKVEKEKSLTTAVKIPDDNPYMEEVIYESLGTSIYEIIEPNMVVFEGKTDKDVFDAFLTKYKHDIKPKNLATISADGVEKIPTYTKFFNGRYVTGYFVVDSDGAGIAVKKAIIGTNKNTYEINDIINTNKKSTLEDLFPKELIEKIILENFSVTLLLDEEKAFIFQIDQENKKLKGAIDIKKLKGLITNYIIKDISKLTKAECIEKYEMYHKFVVEFNKKII